MKKQEIAQMIDHTLLKATATEEQITTLCQEAAAYNFASVCVSPAYVLMAAKLLAGTAVKVCTVVGFPLGANTAEVKAFETRDAIQRGAREIDMVINVGLLKSGHAEQVEAEIRAVVGAANGVLVKVIIETCYLTDAEKAQAVQAAARAGARFVKTSTGFGTGGAVAADVALMKANIPASMEVKASGGIRSYEDALAMIQAGATRIGTSAGIAIVEKAE